MAKFLEQDIFGDDFEFEKDKIKSPFISEKNEEKAKELTQRLNLPTTKDIEKPEKLKTLEIQQKQILSVSELTSQIKNLLEGNFTNVWITGEISNLRRQSSGHIYFTLKDENSQISLVLFRGYAQRGQIQSSLLEDGRQVEIFGDLSVYEQRGQYQIIAKRIQVKGFGELQARFEQLKQKLNAEGLFDTSAKKTLPFFPEKIGIITSPTGAALRDMINVLSRRAPWVEVFLAATQVQGDSAASDIRKALRNLQKLSGTKIPKLDLIIIARGGGSIEDLWAFNDEALAREIFACETPVVSGIGHEIDFTIADFVADFRAPTPSAAVEVSVPNHPDLLSRINGLADAMKFLLARKINEQREKLQRFSSLKFFREPLSLTQNFAQRVDDFSSKLSYLAKHRFENLKTIVANNAKVLSIFNPIDKVNQQKKQLEYLKKQFFNLTNYQIKETKSRLKNIKEILDSLSPTATLKRGFSITMDQDGKIIKSIKDLGVGSEITNKLADGEISSHVEKISRDVPK